MVGGSVDGVESGGNWGGDRQQGQVMSVGRWGGNDGSSGR